MLWESLFRCLVLGVIGLSTQTSTLVFPGFLWVLWVALSVLLLVGWLGGLGFGLGLFLGWVLLVVGFSPRSIVFIRTNFPSILVNSFQHLGFILVLWVGGLVGLVGLMHFLGLLNWYSSSSSAFLFLCGVSVSSAGFGNSVGVWTSGRVCTWLWLDVRQGRLGQFGLQFCVACMDFKI